jgi:hypothetical protein
VIFQDYSSTITLISDNTLSREIGGMHVQYSKIQSSILHNPLGLEFTGKYLIASKERAICDRVYLSGEQYFDNLNGVDFEKLITLSEIYNKTTAKHIRNLIKNASVR